MHEERVCSEGDDRGLIILVKFALACWDMCRCNSSGFAIGENPSFSMESQPDSQNFNQRLSQWIASQGFWFQLRHSMSGGGGWSVALFHLLKIVTRVLLFLLIVGIGLGVYLVQRVESDAYRESLDEKAGEALNAEKLEIKNFKREQGKAYMRRIVAQGSPNSFFESLEASQISFDMGILDGIFSSWDAGVLTCYALDVELRAGANSAEGAEAAGDSIFGLGPNFQLRGVESVDTRISWGYTARTYGGITGSRMVANKLSDGWRMSFTGGKFSQNWLKNLTIDRLLIHVGEGGIKFEEAAFIAGDGNVVFEDVKVVGGERPQVTGKVVLSKVPLAFILPDNVAELVDGTLSGTLELGGSTNAAEGVTMEGLISLGGRDIITARKGVHVLEALDVVDVFHNYSRVDFDSGSFLMRTAGGELELSSIDLQAGELMQIQGRLNVRRPTQEEAMEMAGQGLLDDASMQAAEEEFIGIDVSLSQAGKASKLDEEEKSEVADEGESDLAGILQDSRRLRRAQLERMRKLLLFSGGVRMMIPGDAFERSRQLRERFPVDQATGNVAIDVPLEGRLGNLTTELAEEILRDGVID